MMLDQENLARLLEATTVRSIVTYLEALGEHERLAWRAVGGRENNLATINLGSDPAAGLIERITNAIDAVLEREWKDRREPSNIRSPRQAVEEWFGIREGRLENIENVRASEIQALSRNVEVTLLESERKRQPTIDIRDFGVGISGEEFGGSILSLNETRKLKKFFLAGAFGQGGSTALSFSIYTVIVSRPRESDSAPVTSVTPVAATIVRFNPGDIESDKHGLYEYLVNGKTGQPFQFDVPPEHFAPGTLVRHVCMDVGKYSGILTGPTNSLWYLAHHYLFDPVLPVRLVEQRPNASQGENRFAGGYRRLLSEGTQAQYKRSARRTFRAGTVSLNWWVLTFEGENSQDRITYYTLPSRPIIITYNGQKQGEMSNAIVKNDLRLPYLDRFLIVHVDCDQLDNESRRQLFPTTRENLRDTSLLDELRALVISTLFGDEDLQRLNRERRQRYLQRVDSESRESLRRRLASRLKSFAKSAAGSGPRTPTKDPEVNDPPERKEPIPVQEPPTFLEITTPSPKAVYAGRSFTLRFMTDADPSYFIDPDAFIAVLSPPSVAEYTGSTTLRDGYGIAYFKVNDAARSDEKVEVTLELRPQRAKALDGTAIVVVTDLPEGSGAGPGNVRAPNINPVFVGSTDPFWKENNWDEMSVAQVERTDESTDVYVSSENKNLAKILVRAQRRGLNVVETIKDFYLEHICFHALLEDLARSTETAEVGAVEASWRSSGSEDVGALTQGELGRACETICGIIETMYDLIASTAGEDESD